MATAIYILIIAIGIVLLLINREALLYYFVFLYPILPEYLAVSISSSLPLFTASRMLLIILCFAVLINGRISFEHLKSSRIYGILIFYVLCQTAVCLAHLNDIDTIKTYIGVILENFIFLITVTTMIDSKRKLNRCIEYMLVSAGIVFFLGVLEPITGVNIATTFLDTGARDTLLMSSYERYGSIRAVFSFGHAIALGVYCVAMLPLVMYKINETRRFKYYAIFLLGVGCLLMTMSRGVLAVFFVVFVISMFALDANQRSGYWKVLGITCILGAFILILSPSVYEIAKDSVLSVFNAFGANFDVTSDGNDEAVLSRLSQLSYIPQVLFKYPLFGGGTGYITKNNVYVYLSDRTFKASSIDIEYLSMLINYGIVGFIGGITMYVGILKRSFKKYKLRDPLGTALFLSFVSIFASYFTVAKLTTEGILWLLFAIFISYEGLSNAEEDCYKIGDSI